MEESDEVKKKLRGLKKKFERFENFDPKEARKKLDEISDNAIDEAMAKLKMAKQVHKHIDATIKLLEEGEGNTAESQAQKRLKKIEKTFNDLIKNPPGDVKDAVCKFSFPVKEDCSDLDFSSSEEEDEIVCSYVDSVRLEGRESSNKSTSSKKKQSKNDDFSGDSDDDKATRTLSTTGSTKAETMEEISYAGSNLSSFSRISKRSRKSPAPPSSRGGRKFRMRKSEIKEESEEEDAETISYAPSEVTDFSRISKARRGKQQASAQEARQAESMFRVKKLLDAIPDVEPSAIYMDRKLGPIRDLKKNKKKKKRNGDSDGSTSEGDSTDDGVVPSSWKRRAPPRETITSIQDYCDYIDCSNVPYGWLKNVDLQELVKLGTPRVNREMKNDSEVVSDGWTPTVNEKNYFPVIANIIKSRGNQGFDRGSMLQPMDAIVDSRDGDGTYYYVYERRNRRVQSFSVPQILKDPGPYYGVEEILESRGIYNGTTSGVVSTSASIAKWGINMCMYTCPRVTMCYKVTDKKEEIVPVTQVFLLCHNEEDPENSHIKQFEAKEMKKMRDWKLPKEIKKKGLRFCRWGGVTMCLGDPYRPEARLCTVAMLETTDGNYQAKWYLIRWKICDDQMYGKPKLLELKWLDKSQSGDTTIVDDVKIGYMTSWGDQLYICDVGRQQLYLTDLEGNLRRQIGSENLQPSTKPELFGRPGSITVDAHGNFLVADEANHQIKIFTKTGDFLGLLMHNYVSSPCGLELLDDGRLIYFSKDTSTIYVTKLGPEYEDLEFQREESEGSKRFFDNKYGRGGRGRGRGRGRGGSRSRSGYSSSGYPGFVPGGHLQGTARDVTSSFSKVNNAGSSQIAETFVGGSSVFNEPVFESDSQADVETSSISSSKILAGRGKRVTNHKV